MDAIASSNPGVRQAFHESEKSEKTSQKKKWPFKSSNPSITVKESHFLTSTGRKVELSTYSMSKTPVTVGQYKTYLKENALDQFRLIESRKTSVNEKSKAQNDESWNRIAALMTALRDLDRFDENNRGDDFPVVGIRWKEARDFCRYYGGDLPTGAQFERAAKGKSTKDIYATPLGKSAISSKRLKSTVPVVGEKAETRSNDLGFVDLGGNVLEWTSDRFDPDWWGKVPQKDPHNPVKHPREKVELRSAAWFSLKNESKSDSKTAHLPDARQYIGFRIAWPES